MEGLFSPFAHGLQEQIQADGWGQRCSGVSHPEPKNHRAACEIWGSGYFLNIWWHKWHRGFWPGRDGGTEAEAPSFSDLVSRGNFSTRNLKTGTSTRGTSCPKASAGISHPSASSAYPSAAFVQHTRGAGRSTPWATSTERGAWARSMWGWVMAPGARARSSTDRANDWHQGGQRILHYSPLLTRFIPDSTVYQGVHEGALRSSCASHVTKVSWFWPTATWFM